MATQVTSITDSPTDISTLSITLVTSTKYQLWNNSSAPIYFASTAAEPDNVDGVLFDRCDHVEHTKVAAEKFWAWAPAGNGRLAVTEA